jgi:hypothetical protein
VPVVQVYEVINKEVSLPRTRIDRRQSIRITGFL